VYDLTGIGAMSMRWLNCLEMYQGPHFSSGKEWGTSEMTQGHKGKKEISNLEKSALLRPLNQTIIISMQSCNRPLICSSGKINTMIRTSRVLS
jgi:hypothetical protein